jgi:hypothetical protein
MRVNFYVGKVCMLFLELNNSVPSTDVQVQPWFINCV